MQIIELSRDAYLARIDKPFNPPDSSVPDEEFQKEYYQLYNKLEPILSEFGENDSYGQGDYYLEPGIVRSRGLGFEINNATFVTQLLLNRLQQLLISFAPNWEIYLRSDNFNYGIFIASDAIRFHRDNTQLLPQLKIG